MPDLSSNALRVLEARYLRRDANRNVIESPGELLSRVARAVAHAELIFGSAARTAHWQDEFETLLTSLDFLPNSPTLMNAGTSLGQLSACFVLPVEDTMESIFDALRWMALVQRTGGGTGFSFSALRPRGDLVASTAGDASGPVSFMRIFDCATENIRQGGRRRGANMGVLRFDHPDIMDFVRAKAREGELANFNLSVAVTDRFMDAAARGETYELRHPRTGAVTGRLNARHALDAIARAAWATGDPGLLFLDAIERSNPLPHLGAPVTTNPCGEIPLLPWESCNLGSINLAHMIQESNGQVVLDADRLARTVHTAVRFLDDVVEINRYPSPAIEAMSRANRRIGLGVMGFADALIRMGIPYDSPAAVEMAERIMRLIANESLLASQRLAVERGVFANWEGSTFQACGMRVRNATRTAIAPTGTISIIAGTSASIEPLFALAYRRKGVLGGQTLTEVNELAAGYLERRGLSVSQVAAHIARTGTLRGLPGLPADAAGLFQTALDIPVERHLAIQAAFQRHVDNSVSKTVNLPESAAVSVVADTFRMAWALGLKGVTVFRYGSRNTPVLELGTGEEPYHYDHGSRCDPRECRV
jgi:ribonucleoside-diphosphate reductase alpha chain